MLCFSRLVYWAGTRSLRDTDMKTKVSPAEKPEKPLFEKSQSKELAEPDDWLHRITLFSGQLDSGTLPPTQKNLNDIIVL